MIGGRHKQDVSKASGSARWLYTISVSATTSDYSLAITYWIPLMAFHCDLMHNFIITKQWLPFSSA